jgi:hypothetical protein
MIQVKKKKMPHLQLLTLLLTVKRMAWMMTTAGKFCHMSSLSLFLSNSKNCLDLSICLLLILFPMAYFCLFFTDLILALMVTESNKHAQQVISSRAGNVPTPLKNWTRITMHEMKGFLACVLNIGIIKTPTTESYWSTLCSQATPWFVKMFTKHFFHLVNNKGLPGPGELDYDPCARYQLHVGTIQTGYSGITTPLIKKLVSTKA